MRSIRISLLFVVAAAAISVAACSKKAPPPPDTADGAAKAIVTGLSAHKPVVLWDAMPASYQKDVDGLVKEFAGKMDAELYDKGFTVAKKVIKVLKDKKDFVLGHPMVGANPLVKKDDLVKHYSDVIGLLDTLVTSDISSHAKLASFDVRKFLDNTGSAMMQQSAKLAGMAPMDPFAMLAKIKVEPGKAEGDKTYVKTTDPEGKVEETEFVKVEGKWIPADMSKEWKGGIEEAKKAIGGITKEEIAKQKMQAMAMLAKAEGVIDTLAKADSQEAFNQAVAGIMGSM